MIRCFDCRFWAPDEGGTYGECRRRAPCPAFVPMHSQSIVWPETAFFDLCGEGEPKPAGAA